MHVEWNSELIECRSHSTAAAVAGCAMTQPPGADVQPQAARDKEAAVGLLLAKCIWLLPGTFCL
jgi:hypothetical protein